MWWQLRPVTRISTYARTKAKRWHAPHLIAHFPEKISPEWKDSKFHYHPGFLQGGSAIELRVKMPPRDVHALYEEYSAMAKLSCRGDAKLDRTVGNPDMFPKFTFHTFPREEIHSTNTLALLPSDFQMLLLSSRSYHTNPVSWNHGDCAGLSVSTTRNEVIYWAEAW